MGRTRQFEEITRDGMAGLVGGLATWEPFTRFTVLTCLTPVLPIAGIGAALALVQVVLVMRGAMNRAQLAPLLGAMLTGVAMTCLSVFVIYPHFQRSFIEVVTWVAQHGPGPLARIADVLQWYGDVFFPAAPVRGTTV